MKGAIYHFTDGSDKRPSIYQKQIDELKDFAGRMGVEVEKVYCDFSLKRQNRSSFDIFLAECNEYSALVAKDYYHISKNTAACMKLMSQLREKGITIFTLENGTFDFSDVPYDEPLRVASYTCSKGNIRDVDEAISIQKEIYSLFIKKKTNWTLTGHYSDVCNLQNDSEQLDLMRLIKDKDKYDIILVNNLNDIHWRTSRFCKIREELGKPIFSLQDGFLMYKKED